MIAFLDANALIYLIEGEVRFAKQVRAQLDHLATLSEEPQIAMSELSRLECRAGPMMTHDAAALADYDVFFAQSDLLLVPLSTAVIDLATAIRVRHGLKTPDALQAACCLQLGADHLFLSGDKAFRRVDGLNARMLA